MGSETPLPPPFRHIFTRRFVAEAYRDFVDAIDPIVSDGFDDVAFLFRLHRLPVVVEAARLGGNLRC
jgi:hypothetical protein